jgi:hypothetical protein
MDVAFQDTDDRDSLALRKSWYNSTVNRAIADLVIRVGE